jgi:outer membrane cobalamin receptor
MRPLILLFIACTLAACASSGTRPTRSGDVITAEEIEGASVSTAYDAVARLRPAFLRGRGQSSIQNPGSDLPIVYVNGLRSGPIDYLRNIPAQDVQEIRFVSATDATTRYGTGHTGGVIEVITRV